MKYELENLILEFDDRKTKEALFAHYCDKLECDIQTKLYDEENCVDINNHALNKSELNNLQNEKTWSIMWIEIVNYLKNLKIKSE